MSETGRFSGKLSGIGRLIDYSARNDRSKTGFATGFVVGVVYGNGLEVQTNGWFIITAAHALLDQHGHVDSVEFIIGDHRKGVFPWAVHPKYQWVRDDDYIDGWHGPKVIYDVAIGKLESPFNGVTGLNIFGVPRSENLTDGEVIVSGYPGKGWESRSETVILEKWDGLRRTWPALCYRCGSTTSGMSGGPLYFENGNYGYVAIGSIAGTHSGYDISAPFVIDDEDGTFNFIVDFIKRNMEGDTGGGRPGGLNLTRRNNDYENDSE